MSDDVNVLCTPFDSKLCDYGFEWIIVDEINYESTLSDSFTDSSPVIELVHEGISYVRIVLTSEYGIRHIQSHITDKIYKRVYSVDISLYNGDGEHVSTQNNIIQGQNLKRVMEATEKHILERYYDYEACINEISVIQSN